MSFWSLHFKVTMQFGPCILVAINLVPAIFKLLSIWSLLLNHYRKMPTCLTVCTTGTLKADVAFKIIFKKLIYI